MDKSLIVQARNGVMAARERLVRENAGLVWSVVRRFLGRGQEAEDLFQIGSIGLMKAIDRFDDSYDVQFSTYAVPLIVGEIKRFLRDDGMVKVSRTVKEQARQIYRLKEEIENKEGREPALTELATRLMMSREDAMMAVAACSEIESIHKVIYQSDGNAISLADRLESEETLEETAVNHMALREAFASLSQRDRSIIYQRFFCNRNQTEIAKSLGISQVQVSRLLKKILSEMRCRLSE